MNVQDQITWEQFERRFQEAFGREMTLPERLWFDSLWTAACSTKQEKAKGAAARAAA